MTEPAKSLNVLIAQLAGWKVQEISGGWRIKSPHESKTSLRFAADEREAWIDALDGYIVPHYDQSIDACMEILPSDATKEWFDFSITASIDGTFHARIGEDDPPMGYKHTWEGRGATRAEAIAQATLKYLQWKAGQTTDPSNALRKG